MARNGAGTYSKVNTFVAGNTITAAGHNQNWDDLVAEMTNSVAADGQTTITAGLKGANGTVSVTSYGFASDPNTGVYRHGADELGFATGGVAAGYFDSAQKFFMLGAADIAGLLSLSSTSHFVLPNGTTGQRPGSPAAAMARFNSTTGGVEVYNGLSWVALTPAATVPQGRLTLVTGTPVMVSDASAQSTVYYTPYNGNLIPLYDGTAFGNNVFAELSMVMSGANFASGGIYDLFVASDSGTVRLAIGPVWSTLTAGAGARGTGAGTTELERKFGIWTNKNSATLRYASGSTFTAAANTATYVGTMFMDGTNSQVSCHVSYGQSRKWGLWNAYNRVPINLKAGDSTASWSETTTSYAEINSSAVNFLDVLAGLAEESVDYRYQQTVQPGTNSVHSGIGINSTSAVSGSAHSVGGTSGIIAIGTGRHVAAPTIGVNRAACLFKTSGGSVTLSGSEIECVLSAQWRG